MPEISFYVLASSSLQERLLFACKLIEKAYRSGRFCYVMTGSEEEARIIDDLLWTFRAGSFVPHQRYDGSMPAFEKVILIGPLDPPDNWRATIINLSSRCPPGFDQAERILEILDNNDEAREAGRNRYRQYQQSGIGIITHKLEHKDQDRG
ncbi:MAG: DNA polymerase III subunit chi [Gammaproteobacteria bacterium]